MGAGAGGYIQITLQTLESYYDPKTDQLHRISELSMPATMPVESLTHLELTVNAETARALGLALPRWLLTRADAVIQG